MGLSAIVELKEPSYLLRGERGECEADTRYVVTTCFDRPEFKIWKMKTRGEHNRPEFNFHIKIQTSLTGISKILQSTPEQLVCVDNEKTLKFYDFVDRVEQRKKEHFAEKIVKFSEMLVIEFNKLDKDMSGYLDVEELDSLARMLLQESPEH
jgi:hypothetical protein